MKDIFKCVDKKLLDLFVVDVPTDSSVNPLYDLDLKDGNAFVISADGIMEAPIDITGRLECPTLESITAKDVWKLLDWARSLAPDSPIDPLLVSKMLYNPESDPQKLFETSEKYGVPFTPNRSGECHWWVQALFLPKDRVYLLPDPEHFGCIFCNGEKFAAFALPHYVRKVML